MASAIPDAEKHAAPAERGIELLPAGAPERAGRRHGMPLSRDLCFCFGRSTELGVACA